MINLGCACWRVFFPSWGPLIGVSLAYWLTGGYYTRFKTKNQVKSEKMFVTRHAQDTKFRIKNLDLKVKDSS
jgi:hypothetical protein